MQLTLKKVKVDEKGNELKDENGKEITESKTYVVDHVKARMVRRGFELTESVDFNKMKANDLDNMIHYVVEVYRNQFSVDDVYDGIDSDKLFEIINKCMSDVTGTTAKKIDKLADRKNK